MNKKRDFAAINQNRKEAEKQKTEAVQDQGKPIAKKPQSKRVHIYIDGNLFEKCEIHLEENPGKISHLVNVALAYYFKNKR